MIIREMISSDIDEILEIENLSFSIPWTRSMFESELLNKLAYYLVSGEQDNIIGYIGVHMIFDEGYITNVAISPTYRKNGVGQRLIEDIISYVKGQGGKFVSLEVRVSNFQAISLYKKLGFIAVGERIGYYENPKESALIMTLYF